LKCVLERYFTFSVNFWPSGLLFLLLWIKLTSLFGICSDYDIYDKNFKEFTTHKECKTLESAIS